MVRPRRRDEETEAFASTQTRGPGFASPQRSDQVTVLFACTQNAGRSQMAAALLNLAAEGRARAMSAGTQPAAAIHLVVHLAMEEIGIDLSDEKPQLLTADIARQADLLITMGCADACPLVPGLEVRNWPLDDPKNQPIETVRVIRDGIAHRVADLVREFHR
jgi:arsenate reductase